MIKSLSPLWQTVFPAAQRFNGSDSIRKYGYQQRGWGEKWKLIGGDWSTRFTVRVGWWRGHQSFRKLQHLSLNPQMWVTVKEYEREIILNKQFKRLGFSSFDEFVCEVTEGVHKTVVLSFICVDVKNGTSVIHCILTAYVVLVRS